uniref:Fatty acid synthase-like n=1 Tax=Diabrotica virgifera virgifera TaxID=50390 RepID=A0A6P7F7U3_DIAVI
MSSNKEEEYKFWDIPEILIGIADGVVKPLPNVLFEENEVESAFRFLASGKHKGKVLIEIRKEELYSASKPIRSILATPKVCLDSQQSYIVTGGLGGLGLELAGWLIQKGATRIVLNSRRDLLNGKQAYHFRKWSNYKNITVKVDTSDTSTEEGADSLIRFAQQLGPVGVCPQ